MLLTLGSSGPAVVSLQKALLSIGYNPAGIAGYFGTKTDEAVRQFQKDTGLVTDGKVGPATLAKLNERTKSSVTAEGVHTGNCIILAGVRITVPESLPVVVTNYLDDAEVHFAGWVRTRKLRHIVLHESVTTKKSTTVSVLSAKDLGVHFIIAPDGKVSQHADPVVEALAHGNQLNSTSIGVEVVNPYAPAYANKTFSRRIPAQWWTWVPKGGAKEYVLPTLEQEATIKAFLPWLAEKAGIPVVYPTLYNTSKIANWESKAKPAPGIVAHYDFSSHADGRYPLELFKS